MKFFSKPLFTGFAPADVRKACRYLLLPWNWHLLRSGTGAEHVEKKLCKYFWVPYAKTFDSGRSALFHALKTLDVGEGDEVLVQAYTCVVVINAIHWAGATPVYVDVLDNFTMDPADALKKINPKTKSIMLQHTFGVPADINKLLALAKTHGLSTIEDCAHALGGMYNKKFLGTYADIGMFSFGTDKSISCGRGGALITNNTALAKKISTRHARLPRMDTAQLFHHLWHFPIFYIAKPVYNIFVGKLLLACAKKFHITHRIISNEEKQGRQQICYPATLAHPLADILTYQFDILDKKNAHRIHIANIYRKYVHPKVVQPLKDYTLVVPLRYPLLLQEPTQLHRYAKQQGIILGDWYQTVVAPADSTGAHTQYISGSCPRAETLAQQSINLPTHSGITEKDAYRIVEVVNTYITHVS